MSMRDTQYWAWERAPFLPPLGYLGMVRRLVFQHFF